MSQTVPSQRTLTHLAEMDGRRRTLRAELAQIFTEPRTFVWELGCGHGHFLAAYAQANPHVLCIGIDIVGERIRRALRKRDRAQLKNLFFLHAEAYLFLETLPESARFSDLFVLFPDP